MMKRMIPGAVLLPLLALASGCLIHTTVNPDNSGSMKVSYRVGANDSVEKVKKDFVSPNVEIVNAIIDDKKDVTIDLKYKDITKLNSSRFFGAVAFTVSEDAKAGTKTIKAQLKNKKPMKLPDEQLEAFGKITDFAVTVPGEIVKTNASEKKDSTATWKLPLNDVLGSTDMSFEVTFKPAAADKKS